MDKRVVGYQTGGSVMSFYGNALDHVDHIKVTDKDPSFEKDGVRYLTADAGRQGKVEWLNEMTCQHETTACTDCLEQWSWDHEVVLVNHDGSEFKFEDLA